MGQHGKGNDKMGTNRSARPREERLKEVILKDPSKFDMGSFCGSACCLAGHAWILSGKQEEVPNNREGSLAYERNLASFLGVKEGTAARLCYMAKWPEVFYHAHYISEEKRAALVLDSLEETPELWKE